MALPPLDPQQRRKLLMYTMVVLGLSYLFYDYIYTPKATELTELRTRLEQVEDQNRTARALASGAGTGEVESRLTLYREQLQAVEGLIPSSEELPDLLDAISAEAQRTGVEVILIQPVGATEETYYTRREYDVAVLGGYHAIGEFLTRIASLPRIVTPTNLTLAPVRAAGPDPAEQSGRLEARFSIETYVLSSTENAADDANSE
ncbi:MAG TPA: type 4a pilus biogenesis protein PilO [Longimicrobiaceae bacterium]|nr:type 4a pilus biogenesis protein PilO [Longimicrobiaceae bacterium]